MIQADGFAFPLDDPVGVPQEDVVAQLVVPVTCLPYSAAGCPVQNVPSMRSDFSMLILLDNE